MAAAGEVLHIPAHLPDSGRARGHAFDVDLFAAARGLALTAATPTFGG
jgi:hypothetical protein